MKKFIAAITLIFVLIFPVFPSVTAASPTDAVIEIEYSKETVTPGDVINVTLRLANYTNIDVPEICGIQIDIPMPDSKTGLEYVNNSEKMLIKLPNMAEPGVTYGENSNKIILMFVYKNVDAIPREKIRDLLSFKIKANESFKSDSVARIVPTVQLIDMNLDGVNTSPHYIMPSVITGTDAPEEKIAEEIKKVEVENKKISNGSGEQEEERIAAGEYAPEKGDIEMKDIFDVKNTKSPFYWLTLPIIAILLIGGGITAFVIIKKKKNK